jgi:diacylglycerol kinase (ATP)
VNDVLARVVARKVAVIAHRGKTLGGGLGELRRLIDAEHAGEVVWYEVSTSRKAPRKVSKALARGCDLIVVWGGDGMVQRCADVLAGTPATMAIIPAGTANMFARHLGIPRDLAEAVRIGFRGRCRHLDLGWINGEHFTVMAGIGFDAYMIGGARGRLKNRLGRVGYVWSGLRNLNRRRTHAKVKIDGRKWFSGRASCVLVGNLGTVFGTVEVLDDARTDDGWLNVGVSTARGAVQWTRAMARAFAGTTDRSPFIQTARAKRISIKLSTPSTYELDGGVRKPTTRLRVRVVPAGLTVRIPDS